MHFIAIFEVRFHNQQQCITFGQFCINFFFLGGVLINLLNKLGLCLCVLFVDILIR